MFNWFRDKNHALVAANAAIPPNSERVEEVVPDTSIQLNTLISTSTKTQKEIDSARTELLESTETCRELDQKTLSCEHEAKVKLANELNKLELEMVELEIDEFSLQYGFPQFDLEMALRMRDNKGLPRLLPFDLNTPEFRLGPKKVYRTDQYRDGHYRYEYRIKLRRCSFESDFVNVYDIYDDLLEKYNPWQTDAIRQDRPCPIKALKASFPGVIPSAVRDLIAKHTNKFDRMFFVADCTDHVRVCEIEDMEMVELPAVDPFLIGEKKDKYYLVKAFNTTSYEEWAAAELTS